MNVRELIEAKASPWATETEKGHIEELEKQLYSDLNDPSPGWPSTAPSGPLMPMVSLVGKESLRQMSSFHSVARCLPEAHVDLTSQELLRRSANLDHWGSDRNREERGAYSNRCSDLGWPLSHLQWCQTESPGSSCTHLQTQPVVLSDRQAWLSVLPALGPQPMGHMGSGVRSRAPPGQGNKFIVPSNAEHSLQSCPTKKHGHRCLAAWSISDSLPGQGAKPAALATAEHS